jgi:polyphenol oxidase
MPNEPAPAPATALPLIHPQWAGGAPPGVVAAMSTRAGGTSVAPWASLNLGRGVGDDEAAVAANRERFATALGARPVWLRQVHSATVLALDATTPERPDPPADAAWTTTPGIACTVMAADCLPVLFAAIDGSAVAASHAGWRGLAAGVLEATVAALAQGADVAPGELQVWLGPCIGLEAFEVGADVLHAFGREARANDQPAFRFSPREDGSPRWRADLQALAVERLRALGVQAIAQDRSCTVADGSRFFSFRRDGLTGRLAAAIAIGR